MRTGLNRLLGSCHSPRPGWASLGAHLSSSTRSLWFSLVATALVLCSRCRASRSALSTFSSSSSSAFCFCKSPCLVEEAVIGSAARFSLPQATSTPGDRNRPSQKNGDSSETFSLWSERPDGRGARGMLPELGLSVSQGPRVLFHSLVPFVCRLRA